MKKRWRISLVFWMAAFFLTLLLSVYQRRTGPTWPKTYNGSIGGISLRCRLLRSYEAGKSLPVSVQVTDQQVTGYLLFRRIPSQDLWQKAKLQRSGHFLKGRIPGQPPAGKVEYKIRLQRQEEKPVELAAVIARFKGHVPLFWLVIHIVFMVASIMLAFRTGLECFRRIPRVDRLALLTLGAICLGGLIFGPVVQKYAFGDFWTGFPFGSDLTDNKTLLVFLFWGAALFLKKKSHWWLLAATLLMLAIYLIPHSLGGSELNYEDGTMTNKYSFIQMRNVKYNCFNYNVGKKEFSQGIHVLHDYGNGKKSG